LVTELDPIPLPHLGGILLHGEKIYWGSDGNYFSVNKDGSGKQSVAQVPEPVRIKLLLGASDDAGNTYFAQIPPTDAHTRDRPPRRGVRHRRPLHPRAGPRSG
jgi:hypothetical protein